MKREFDYHQLAKSKGHQWIGTFPSTTRDKTTWKCRDDHVWDTSFQSLKASGNGCPYCAGRPPKFSEDYHQVASERGIKWVGYGVPLNVRTPTRWRCSCGEEWEAAYVVITKEKRFHGCSNCQKEQIAQEQRLSNSSYHSLAEQRGFKWLGPTVMRNGDHTKWECAQGHKWRAAYTHIQQGKGCPHCAKNFLKTPEDYHLAGLDRGIIWLGPEVLNTHTLTTWRCESGHTWEAIYLSIANQGTGCPICAGNTKKTEDDYFRVASKRGITWLGPLPDNVVTKTWWQCSIGHKWEAIYHNIRRGSGCPKCADMVNGSMVSKPQRDLCNMLEPYGTAVINMPHGRWTIDVALTIKDKKFAVEYDCWYWHKENLERDTTRDRELIQDGWRVLRVKSSTKLPTQTQLDAALAELVGGAKYTEIVLDDWGGS